MQTRDPSPKIENVRRIAVLRANGLGDFMFSLPAIASLRAAYPHSELVLLGAAWHERAVPGRVASVDRIVVVPPTRGIRRPQGTESSEASPQELDAFFDAMQSERFDLAVQMHGGGRHSNPFIARLNARVTVGLKSPDAQPLDRWTPYVYYQNEVLRLLDVARLAGADGKLQPPSWRVLQHDREELRAVLDEHSRPLVVVCPGAGDPRRRWTPTSFAEVGDALAAEGAEVAVSASAEETGLAAEVKRAARCPSVDLSGRLSVGGLGALFERASLVVANDSGSLHLARAGGAPTVGIYWCGNAINAGPIDAARHRVVLSWRVHCPVCGRSCLHDRCEHEASFVSDVPVSDVIREATEVLREEKGEWR